MSRKSKKEELSESETTEESETETAEEYEIQKLALKGGIKFGNMGNVGRYAGSHTKKKSGNYKKTQPQRKVTPVKSKPKHKPSNETVYFPAPGSHSLAYTYIPPNPNPGPYPNSYSYQDPYKQHHYPPSHYPYAYNIHWPYPRQLPFENPQVTYPQKPPQPGVGAIPEQGVWPMTNQGHNESNLSKGGAQMGTVGFPLEAQPPQLLPKLMAKAPKLLP